MFSIYLSLFFLLFTFFSFSLSEWGSDWKSLLSSPNGIPPLNTKDEIEGKKWIENLKRIGESHDIIIAASIPRSGSTLFFNLVRLLEIEKENQNENSVVGTFAKWHAIRAADEHAVVIKAHGYTNYWKSVGDIMFANFRDPRGSVSSFVSMWPSTRKSAKEIGKKNCMNGLLWKSNGAYGVRYELMSRNISKFVEEVAKILHIKSSPQLIEKIVFKLDELKSPKSRVDVVTQIHPNHVTNLGDQWDKVLTLEEINSINKDCEKFMIQHGYDFKCLKQQDCRHPFENMENHSEYLLKPLWAFRK